MPKSSLCEICSTPLCGRPERFCSRICKSKSQIKRITLVCQGCGKKFQNLPYLKRKTNYCSLQCYWDSMKLKEKRTCQVCEKTFQVKRYLVIKGFGNFCSRKCQHETYPKRKLIKCKQCGKSISIQPCRVDKVKFCSKVCQDNYYRDYVDCVCKNCDSAFQISRSNINRGRGLFCSWSCFIHYKGESTLESKVRRMLENLKINYVQEAKFGRYHVDFLVGKVAIECDGEYWHMSKVAKLRDGRKDDFLRKQGYKIVRLLGDKIVRSSNKELGDTLLQNIALD